jgi:large subunit ribosomal protein L5
MSKQKIVLKDKYRNEIRQHLNETFSYGNVMEIPKLEKVVINRGVGQVVVNKKYLDIAINHLIAITGQKPMLRRAKKAISNFKIRKGQVIGCMVTLRNDSMYDFLTKLFFIALPRIRDFRGVNPKSFDGRGNFTLSIKDHATFPEIKDADNEGTFGFDITFVTTAKSDKEAYELLKALGMVFRKN